MATRYARETGRTLSRFNKPTDPQSIHYLARCRKAPRWSAAHATYRRIVERVCAPTLASLVAAEQRVGGAA